MVHLWTFVMKGVRVRRPPRRTHPFRQILFAFAIISIYFYCTYCVYCLFATYFHTYTNSLKKLILYLFFIYIGMFFCVGNTNCLLFHSWQQVSVFGGHDLGVFLESSWAGW